MGKKLKTLLLNPPGSRRYIRDCYCSTVSKGAYLWHPADLLAASGILNGKSELLIIDAVAERLSQLINRVMEFQPDFVYMLTSVLSYSEDIEIASLIKSLLPGVKIIGSGEPFLSKYAFQHAKPFDFAIRNYTNTDVLHIIRGNYEDLKNALMRNNKNEALEIKKREERVFSIGIPQHNKFKKNRYWMPFIKLPFATLITDFGCPYKCKFCNSNFFGYYIREMDEVLEDISYISDSGYKHIFVKDMTFLVNKNRSLQIAEEIHKRKMSFNCYSRVDLLNRTLLDELKKLGLRTLQFGVESFDEKVMMEEGKKIEFDKVKEIFEICRELKIFTGLHLVLRLPKEKMTDSKEIIKKLRKLKPSYVSINVFTLRIGSYYLKEPLDTEIWNWLREEKGDVHLLKLKILLGSLTLSLFRDVLKDLRKDNFVWYVKNFYYMIRENLN